MSSNASPLQRPVGHEELVARLEQEAARQRAAGNVRRLHHAYLMAGPAGVGKFRTALWWTALLKCRRASSDGINGNGPATDTSGKRVSTFDEPAAAAGDGACGGSSGETRREKLCASCRLLTAGSHPDLSLLEPPEGKSSIGIDGARGLIRSLGLKPVQAGPRIAIVREAHSLTVEAQSALLKLLEEPPGSTVIILVADNVSSLLATVRSRCRLLRFGVLSEAECTAVLISSGVEEQQARAAAAVSGGSAGRALAYDAAGLAAREELIEAFEALRKSPEDVEDTLQIFMGRKALGYGLEELLDWQLRKIRSCLGYRASESSASLEALLDNSREQSYRRLVSEASRTRATIVALQRNVGAKIAIRDMLLNIGN